jgi:hypothetical protein
MFSAVWFLTIGWLIVVGVNALQMRSMERHWDDLLHEHANWHHNEGRWSQPEIIEPGR